MRLTIAAVRATQHYFFARSGDPAEDAPVPRRLERLCTVERRELGGLPVVTLTPRSAPAPIDLVYFHGGSYNAGLISPHWTFIGQLVRRTGATVHVPSYPLAPDHAADEAYAAIDAAVAEIENRAARGSGGPGAERRLVFAGDSAGGTIALVEALRAHDVGGRTPDHVAVVSPWVDATMENPEAREIQPRDPSLNVDLLAAAARTWAGEREVSDPLLSPTFTDPDELAGLPSLTVIQGGRDVFAPDVAIFVDRVRAAGVAVRSVLAEDGFHVYPCAWWTPEAVTALAAIAEGIRGAER